MTYIQPSIRKRAPLGFEIEVQAWRTRKRDGKRSCTLIDRGKKILLVWP